MTIPRRRFLQSSAIAGLGLAIPRQSLFIQPADPGDRYKNLKSGRYLGKVKIETRINDREVLTEGPAVDKNGQVFFSNIPVNKILKWDPATKELSVFSEDSHGANGLRFTENGDLLVCEGGSGNIVRIDMNTGETTVLADQFQGKKLQSPNDLDIDSQGRIYFSSRTNEPDLEEENLRAFYRLDPGGAIHQLLAEPNIHMPNGVVVSPDEKILYLIDAHPGANHNRNMLAFDLQKDGTLANRRMIFDFYPGRSGDGMCIDVEGNLYVAAGLHNLRGSSETLDIRPGIHVISPDGQLLAYRKTPEDIITNCTFGGNDLRTLYITCRTYLLSIRTRIPGKSSYRPQS